MGKTKRATQAVARAFAPPEQRPPTAEGAGAPVSADRPPSESGSRAQALAAHQALLQRVNESHNFWAGVGGDGDSQRRAGDSPENAAAAGASPGARRKSVHEQQSERGEMKRGTTFAEERIALLQRKTSPRCMTARAAQATSPSHSFKAR